MVTINNKDELCCARAIVTKKAREDNDPQYKHLRLGHPFQKQLAKKLHQDAGVSEGPCGREELKKFQVYLGSEYQLIVLEGMKGQLLFKDRAYDRAHKVISLVKTKHHYHQHTCPVEPKLFLSYV